MPENRLKRPRDPAQLAKLMIDIASRKVENRQPPPSLEGKDAAANTLGRRGGLKGAKARAAKMSPTRRAEIARKARNQERVFPLPLEYSSARYHSPLGRAGFHA